MENQNPKNRLSHSLRVVRPLFWWLILIVVLYLIRTHQRLIEQTRVVYTVSLQGRSVLDATKAQIGERIVVPGDKISLGWHTFSVSHPKAESFSTNLFVWYGGSKLGQINLKRTLGSLNVTAKPAASVITIIGPEFSLTLHNSTGTNLLIPTDRYRVRAQYARWSDARDYMVTAGSSLPCRFEPQMGAISLTCNKSPATYRLQGENGNASETGNVPATLTDLPIGNYDLLVTYHNHELKKRVSVSENKTNDIPFDFEFGAARFQSMPSGAKIYSKNNNYLGITPVTVTELSPSTEDYRLKLEGYDNVTVSVKVTGNQTNLVTTNLVSLAYIDNWRAAQKSFASGDYRGSLSYLEQSLKANPGDLHVLKMQTTAKGRLLVQEGKDLANRDEYSAALQKLQSALEILPDDPEAKRLLSEYQKQKVKQIATAKQKRTRELFDSDCKLNPLASLFDEHQIVITNKTPDEVKAALIQNCETITPTLKVTLNRSAESDLYEILMLQSSQNPLVTARRECLMVIGKGKDDQTVILFKLIEFQMKPGFNLTDALLRRNSSDVWVPLHSSRIQMTEAHAMQIRVGVEMMTTKINAVTQ